jgi:phosphoglycolate phosphatase
MTHPAPKAILFDWDNTLADTWPLIHAALCDTLRAMGHEPWTLEKTKREVHRSMRDSFPELFGDRWEEAGRIYQKSYRSHRTIKLAALPYALELLKALKQKPGLYVAVVSNKIGTSLREEVAQLGWNQYFAKIIGAQDAAEDKPSKAPVLLALDGSNIEPGKHVWFIGDSLTDMECAYNSGCHPIFYGDADPTTEKYSHCRPAVHVADHKALMALL